LANGERHERVFVVVVVVVETLQQKRKFSAFKNHHFENFEENANQVSKYS
jgi:hypothetical protein